MLTFYSVDGVKQTHVVYVDTRALLLLLHSCTSSPLLLRSHTMQAAEQQQGLQASDLTSKILKDVVDAKHHAKPDINTSIYRHNSAKGPNPMASKKKKRKVQQAAQSESAAEPKQKRARKRRKPC